VFELELHARGKKSRAFEQSADKGVDAIFQHAAEAFGYARVGVGEFPCLLVEQLKFPIVKVEKFTVHAASSTMEDNLAGIYDVGDEFNGEVDRLAHQLGTDDEPHLEITGVDAGVSLDR
jgi:hypothetical protein